MTKKNSESNTAFSWVAASVLVGNIVVGVVVIVALLTLKSGWCLLGLAALPTLWTYFKTGGDEDDREKLP